MKKSIVLFVLLFLSTCFKGYSEDVIDVETLPCDRSRQYSLGPYRQIVVFSPSRTGSSLVYNVFRFIFEDSSYLFAHHNEFNLDRNVLKTHKVPDLESITRNDVLYIYTIRNPYNACISNYRICTHAIPDKREFAEQLVNRHVINLLLTEKMTAEGKHVLWIKYEDFASHVDHLFEVIEGHFHISINAKDKELMRRGYSKANIAMCTQDLTDFNEYLPISGFHGHHILLKEYSPPPNFLHWLKVYVDKVKPLFQNYGYFVTDS